MTRYALLNNVDHHDLRIDCRRAAALGDALMCVPTFPAEFRELQAHYPIVFGHDGQSSLVPLALFGLREAENLFLSDEGEGWDATYVPLAVERQPFLIGVDVEGTPMIHIDLESPRVGNERGEAVFREYGGNTDYLDRVASVLRSLHEGRQAAADFVSVLQHHRLLEPFVLSAQLASGAPLRLAGLQVLNEERLRELDGSVLDDLHRRGHVEAIYMALASMSRFRDLIERANRRHAGHR